MVTCPTTAMVKIVAIGVIDATHPCSTTAVKMRDGLRCRQRPAHRRDVVCADYIGSLPHGICTGYQAALEPVLHILLAVCLAVGV